VQYSSLERSLQQDADASTRSEQPPDKTFTINRVGIRVPPFWSVKPAVRFAQLEDQFALSNITQHATQFYCVISQLDNKQASEVEGVITNQPTINQPTNQPTTINQLTIKPINHQQPTNQPSFNQPTNNKPINQPTNQSTN
jgi:hypothetical protein